MKTKSSLLSLGNLAIIALLLLSSCKKTSIQDIDNSKNGNELKASPTGTLGLCYSPFYQYYSSSDKDHYYTQVNGTFTNYTFINMECQVNGCEQGDFVPFYEFYSSSDKDHYYTTTWGTYTNYNYIKVAGYVLPASYPTPGDWIPLYEYYSYSDKDHYYTVTYGTYSGYTYIKVAGYVFPRYP